MSGGDPFRDGARDQGVRRQRKVGTVLFETPDGKHGDLTGDTGPPLAYILRGVRRQQTGYRRARSRTTHVSRPFDAAFDSA